MKYFVFDLGGVLSVPMVSKKTIWTNKMESII